jgi:hypothetical protein
LTGILKNLVFLGVKKIDFYNREKKITTEDTKFHGEKHGVEIFLTMEDTEFHGENHGVFKNLIDLFEEKKGFYLSAVKFCLAVVFNS